MPKKVNIEPILADLLRTGESVSAGELAGAMGVSRQAAHRHLSRAVSEGTLVRVGGGRSTRYVPAETPPATAMEYAYPVPGMGEDRIWADLVLKDPALGALDGEAEHVFHYALTEVVNNVIDHSGATEVHIRIEGQGGRLAIEVVDEGVGAFHHVMRELGLASPLEALQEISKGKTTTMPDRHSGEGLFFVSKAADWFVLESGALAWIVDHQRRDMAVVAVDPPRGGTRVRFEARPAHVRPLRAIFDEYTEDFEFARTRTTIKLFEYGVRFVSRSEAKRLVHNLDRFQEVILDFHGVEGVGQGFADEVFRVWARANPAVTLRPVRMNEPVTFMVERARRAATQGS